MTEVPDGSLCDSHLHLFDLLPHQPDCLTALERENRRVITSCHSPVEVAALSAWLKADPALAGLVGLSFGIHPQLPVRDQWDFLQALAEAAALGNSSTGHPKLVAIGECGFDFFLGREIAGPQSESVQEPLFLDQLALAIRCGLPLVVHIRRATDLIFRHIGLLKRLPAIIFHAWPAPPEEGLALLRHGVNAWFGLGTPLLQGNKKAIRSLQQLPIDRILLETDAPYQKLRGRPFTGLAELGEVYAQAARLRGLELAQITRQVAGNFNQAYGLGPGTTFGSKS